MTPRVAAGVALCALALLSPMSPGVVSADAEERSEPPSASTAMSAGSPGFTFTHRGEEPMTLAYALSGDSPSTGGASSTSTASSTNTGSARGFVPPPNDDFVFDFDGVDAAREAVFEAAAGIWSDVLEVEVPIAVRVSTMSFSNPNILGGAEPTDILANEVSFPVSNVWFVAAQANQFASRDLDPSQPEIDIVISSDFDFYEGVDDRVPDDRTSLLYLALHELGHGLGHITLARQVDASWSITWPSPMGTQLPLAYDLLLLDGARTPLATLPAGALGSALTSRVLWSGREATAADDGRSPVIYAPRSFQPGSSTSHLDQRTYPASLMTPSIADGEAHLAIPELTQAMFADFGWGLEVSGAEESFVTALSRDFLRTFPTPSVRNWVVGALRDQAARRDIVQAYATSDVHLGRLLDRYSRSTLDRPAEPAERRYWLRELRDGRTPASVAAAFYSSAEYYERAGNTDVTWITDLYREILGREPDPEGLAIWVGKASSGTDRTSIAFAFYQSRESRSKRVTDLYRVLLGRAPEPDGLEHWRRVLDNGRDVHMAIDLAHSGEYQRRALQRYG